MTLLADVPAELEDEDGRRLAAAGVTIDERRSRAAGSGRRSRRRRLHRRHRTALRGAARGSLHQRSPLAAHLGAAVGAQQPPRVGDVALEVDARFQSDTVPGLSAAGDLSSQMPSVANAVAAGSNAAAAIVRGLVT